MSDVDLRNLLSTSQFDEVKALIQRGLSADSRLGDQGEPLLVASIRKDCPGLTAFIDWLIEHGADIHASSHRGRTALHQAAWQQQPQVIEQLLAHGAQVNATDREGRTPLSMAATKEIVELLLNHGAEVNVADSEGTTPLMELARDAESVALLLAYGADPLAADDEGWTALHKAIEWHILGPHAAEPLIKHGADVNAVNKEGVTPLHLASKENDEKAVTLLLAAGANPNVRTVRDIPWDHFQYPKGTTPLDAATGKEVKDLLKRQGATPREPLMPYPLKREGISWSCHVPLSGDDEPALGAALNTMIDVLDNVVAFVFHHPDYSGTQRTLSFVIDKGSNENPLGQLDETGFFEACIVHPNLIDKIKAYIKAIIVQNDEGMSTLYVHEEMETGTQAMRALLRHEVAGAIDLYVDFLHSVDLDHSVETHTLVREIMAQYPKDRLKPLEALLDEYGFDYVRAE